MLPCQPAHGDTPVHYIEGMHEYCNICMVASQCRYDKVESSSFMGQDGILLAAAQQMGLQGVACGGSWPDPYMTWAGMQVQQVIGLYRAGAACRAAWAISTHHKRAKALHNELQTAGVYVGVQGGACTAQAAPNPRTAHDTCCAKQADS